MKMLLPNHKWLVKNGYKGLYKAMTRHPSRFNHIPCSDRRRKPNEWVRLAERLAKEYGGLPGCGWLNSNGYSGLPTAIRNRPELFTHIKRLPPKFTYIDGWVKVAEMLAAKHNGQLPNSTWLIANGHRNLDAAIKRSRDSFTHIPQLRKGGRSAADWIPYAEELVRIHGGLPNSGWLQRNGFRQLYVHARKHPELFAHIPRLGAENTA